MSLVAFRARVEERIKASELWREYLTERSTIVEAQAENGVNATTWSDVEIRFLSDLRVQSVVKGKTQEPRNYAELGFADARSQASKPRAAWETLRSLAESHGVLSSTPTAAEWSKLEKRMQEIRQLLKASFCIDDDPVPYIKGAYRAQFKIVLTPPYEA